MVFIITASGFVMLGRVFQVDVVALITGLGLGGLALALAARETSLFAEPERTKSSVSSGVG
jgi:MscS family membrane protein